MFSGICCPNRPMTADDYRRAALMQARSAKLMWYHTGGDVAALRRAGVVDFSVRIPDLWELSGEDWWRKQNGHRLPGSREWAAYACSLIDGFYPIVDYQVGNEPQSTVGQRGMWVYQSVMREAMQELDGQLWETEIHGEIRFGLPPLSYAPALWSTLRDWKTALTASPGGRQPYASLFKWAGANSYWQTARAGPADAHVTERGFGGSFQDVHDWTGLPVRVTEYGCSDCDLSPRPSDDTIQTRMRAYYPEWLRFAGGCDYVQSSALFILGSEQWGGFVPTDRTLQAMAG